MSESILDGVSSGVPTLNVTVKQQGNKHDQSEQTAATNEENNNIGSVHIQPAPINHESGSLHDQHADSLVPAVIDATPPPPIAICSQFTQNEQLIKLAKWI